MRPARLERLDRLVLFNRLSLLSFIIPAFSLGADSSRTVIVSPAEPGAPMIVSGTVYNGNRANRPAAGIRVEVYQTDSAGYYNRVDGSASRPRIKGAMITDSAGRYEFITVKPGAYPGDEIAAHIHFVIVPPGFAKQTDLLEFEGDRFVKRSNSTMNPSDAFATVQPVTLRDDTLRVIKDIRLE